MAAPKAGSLHLLHRELISFGHLHRRTGVSDASITTGCFCRSKGKGQGATKGASKGGDPTDTTAATEPAAADVPAASTAPSTPQPATEPAPETAPAQATA